MQNRYVGDIGDYVKLAILRALAPGRRLGIAWWLFPDETHNKDSRHIDYLARPDQWRRFDPPLFDGLKAIIQRGERQVRALEPLLPFDTVFCADVIPCVERPPERRPVERLRWLAQVSQGLDKADLVFLDPDNGIAPETLGKMRRSAGKSVFAEEVAALRRPGRSIVLYHHQTRRKGGHVEELRHVGTRLCAAGLDVAGALRASPWSPRAFPD